MKTSYSRGLLTSLHQNHLEGRLSQNRMQGSTTQSFQFSNSGSGIEILLMLQV